MKSTIAFFVFFACNSSVFCQSGSCKTPVTLKDGFCVTIEACKNLNAVKNNTVYKLYLEKSKCLTNTGIDGVCCEKHEIDTQVAILFVSQKTENTTNYMAELRSHPKFNMLSNIDCGQNIYDRISYGNLTKAFEHPWMALLKYKDFDGSIGFYCGGSLITKRYVLTAAHCLKSTVRELIQVRLGEHDLNKISECIDDKAGEMLCTAPVQDLNVEKIISHPMYNKQQRINDIGLIKLNKSANLNEDSITPICLPTLEHIRSYRPKNYIIVGWGSTEKGRNSDVLLQAKIFPVSKSLCEQNLQVKLKSGQICAGGNGKVDNCQGDSGGPLTAIIDELKYVQYGIVSFGQKGCGEKELPGVYTNVADYVHWILDTLES